MEMPNVQPPGKFERVLSVWNWNKTIDGWIEQYKKEKKSFSSLEQFAIFKLNQVCVLQSICCMDSFVFSLLTVRCE